MYNFYVELLYIPVCTLFNELVSCRMYINKLNTPSLAVHWPGIVCLQKQVGGRGTQYLMVTRPSARLSHYCHFVMRTEDGTPDKEDILSIYYEHTRTIECTNS